MKALKIFVAILVMVTIFGSGCIKNPFAPDETDVYADANGICQFTETKTQTIFDYNFNNGQMTITGTSTQRAEGRVTLYDKEWENREGHRFSVWLDHSNSFVDLFNGSDKIRLRIEIEKDNVRYEIYVALHR